jgi:hypothetical protein
MINFGISGIEEVMKKLAADVTAASKIEVDATKHKLLERLKAGTPVATGNAQRNWKIEGSAIVNHTEYLSNLNAGSSQQAPAFFIESAVLNTPGVKPSGTVVTYE